MRAKGIAESRPGGSDGLICVTKHVTAADCLIQVCTVSGSEIRRKDGHGTGGGHTGWETRPVSAQGT